MQRSGSRTFDTFPRAPAGCTIISRNYLAHARTLAQSYARHEPEGRFYVLVVDGLPDGAEVGAGARVLSLDDLEIPDLAELSFKYDVTEFSTAVKPSFFSSLLTSREETIIYFDPDILLFRPLVELGEVLASSNIVLIPHLLDPIPLDGRRPSEQDILVAGTYNLGFIALRRSPQTHAFLAWWRERLQDGCFSDPWQGLMTDQKWVDLVPGLFPPVSIFRDETYNVAYWNIHSRHIEQAGQGRFLVNGKPLAFFHFSGFNPMIRDQLSRYDDRTTIDDGSALADVLDFYSALLMENGYPMANRWRYGFERFSNGLVIHPVMRRLYRDLPRKKRRRFDNPFDVDAPRPFLTWATRPRKSLNGLSPFLNHIYWARSWLVARFPKVGGRDRKAFLAWARTTGAKEIGYDPACVREHSALDLHGESSEAPVARTVTSGTGPSTSGTIELEDDPSNHSRGTMRDSGQEYAKPASVAPNARDTAGDHAPLHGVNVSGYLRDESGVGAAARGYVRALQHLGIPVALHDLSHTSTIRAKDSTFTTFDAAQPYDVNLVCVNAHQHARVVAEFGEAYFFNHYNIGVWAWELPTFPAEWHDLFDVYNEIWVGTSFIANALAPASPIPVVRIPPAIALVAPGSRAKGRERLGVSDDEFVFVFIFDFFSYVERKNPAGVIDAFVRAFSPADPVRLVIKCVNEHFNLDGFRNLQALATKHGVSIHTGYWTPGQMRDLMAACDAYVSLHRSEGIGLTIAEAMAIGKPVIATAWSGNTDYMNITNSFPVRYTLVRLERDVGPYRAGETWAEPSTEHAAEQMQTVYKDREDAEVRGAAAKAEIEANYSTERVARLVQERLAVIKNQLSTRLAHEGSERLAMVSHGTSESERVDAQTDDVLLYVVGGAGSGSKPDVRDFQVINQEEGESELSHLARVAHEIDKAIAGGGTHLLLPRELADWLGDHPLVVDYFAERHELVEASAELGLVFRLLPPDPANVSSAAVRD